MTRLVLTDPDPALLEEDGEPVLSGMLELMVVATGAALEVADELTGAAVEDTDEESVIPLGRAEVGEGKEDRDMVIGQTVV